MDVQKLRMTLQSDSEAFQWYEAGMLPTMGQVFEAWRLDTRVCKYNKECIAVGKPLTTPVLELATIDVDGNKVKILSVHPFLMNHREALGGLQRTRPGDQLLQSMTGASGARSSNE